MRVLSSTLYLVVPCYNEEPVLHETARRLSEKMKTLSAAKKISHDGRVVFVDDGSSDGTWGIIEELCMRDSIFAAVKLSRNRGHQHALMAGLMAVRHEADFVITIDADLQDDISSIDLMVEEYIGGCDIVYGVRKTRETDGFFKRVTAEGYYKLLRSYGCDIVFNHADFRLMSSRALNALSEYREQRLFVRGLVPLLGYKSSIVRYKRDTRKAGVSKYPLKRMLSLAFDGLTALSLRPLRMVTALGVVMLLLSAVFFVYMIVTAIMGQSVLDWKLVIFSVWAVGGIITLCLGIVGEYVGRTFIEAKGRPRYSIEKTAGLKEKQSMDIE